MKKIILIGMLFPLLVMGQQKQYVPIGFTAKQYKDHMEWWDNAKFGLFVHWGVYAVAGGEWKGKDYGKEQGGPSAEWLMLQAMIPKQEYKEELATRFNPTKFDAEEWVKIAKNAGMKYINITAKHHDGFSLYDTKYSDFDVMEATPFKRDILKELAQACKKHDMKLGFYYSHHIDWWRRGLKKGSQLKQKPTKEYHEFVKNQLTELLTNYGDVMAIWFDLGSNRDKEENLAYYQLVRELQPSCIVSGRLQPRGNLTDYFTPKDRQIATKQKATGYVEACMTTRLNWGYDKNDNNWPASDDMIRLLSLSTARHSNYLLNVGPQPDGQFTPEEKQLLADFGAWMKINAEAIHNTKPSPYQGDFKWGTVTTNRKVVYAHVLNKPVAEIVLPKIEGDIKSVRVLGVKNNVVFTHENKTLKIELPSLNKLKSEVAIVKVEFHEVPKIESTAKVGYTWRVPQRDLKGIKNTYIEWSSGKANKAVEAKGKKSKRK